MSRIDELIERLCPDGVEYRELNSFCLRTQNIKWGQTEGDSLKYIDLTSVDLHTRTIMEVATVNEGNAPSRAQQVVETGDVIFATTRPTQMRACKITSDYNGQVCSTGFCVLRPNEMIDSSFLLHMMRTDAFGKYLEDNQTMGNYPAISNKKLMRFRIPVPPMEVQEEIVRVLDSFAELEAELEAELKAELEARRKQYEYYRDRLLAFPEGEVQWTTLGEVASYSKDRVSVSSLSENGYVGVNELLQDFRGRSSEKRLPAEENCTKFSVGDILLGNIRPYLRKMWLADSCGGTNGDVLVICVAKNKGVLPRYIWHCLTSSAFVSYNVQNSKGAKMPRGDKQAILRYCLPLPPLAEQQHIVDILDKFDTLVNDISTGLPAELEARRKQYEYYRDKLLTFKEKTA